MKGDLTFSAARQATDETLDLAGGDSPPVCLCVCDAAGDLVVFGRMDAAPARLIAIVKAKAYTAARMRCSTLDFRRRLLAEQLTLEDFCDPSLTGLPGGVPVFRDRDLIAAVAVSGRTLDEDEALARLYAERLRLAIG